MQKKNIGFVYDNFNFDLANKLLQGFEFAKDRLGMKLDGPDDDYAFVEIPSEQDLMAEYKLSKNDVRNGGKYIYCLSNELF